MEVAIGRKKQLAVYGNNYNTKDGTGIRDYIHVSDLAKAHIDSINYISNNKENLIINLGNEIGYSVLDVINKASEISEKKIEYRIEPKREGDIDSLIANTNLAKKLIGWKPRYSDLDTIINSTWEIYKTRRSL